MNVIPQSRIATLRLQTIILFVLAVIVLAFAGTRSDTLIYELTCGWFTCGDRLLPPLNDQFAIFEFLHHWSVIIMAVSVPTLVFLWIITNLRADEDVLAGMRNAALLLLLQGLAALGTTVVYLLWQAPAIHFFSASLILVITVIVVAWAIFSPNQDYAPRIFLGAMVVVSMIPLVAYISQFV